MFWGIKSSALSIALVVSTMFVAGCSLPNKPGSGKSTTSSATPTPTPTAPIFTYTGNTFANTSIGYPVNSTVTLKLTNNMTITLLGHSFSAYSPFTNLGTGTCTFGRVLHQNETCTINLRFNPTQTETTQSTLIFDLSGSQLVNATSILLSATSDDHLPNIQLSSYSVPDVIYGASSAPIPITVTNTGNKNFTPANMSFATARYSIASSTCGASIAAGATCTINVVFTPHAISNNITDVLTITDGVTTKTYNFSGNGIIGPITHFALTGFPGTVTAGSAQTLTITAKDAYENTVTSYAGTVTLSSSDGAATLGAPATLTSGIRSFSATLSTVGTQSITASDGIISSSKTGIIVNPAATHHLVFTTQPSTTNTAGVNFGTQPVVKIYDQYNNLKTDINTGSITLSVNTGSLASGTTASITAGVATFAAVKTNHAGAGKILTATYSAVSTTSNSFSVDPAAIASIAFSTQPSSTANTDANLVQQPAITAYDAFSNIVTNNSTTLITLTAHTDATCATAAVNSAITATANPKALVAGIATFANARITNTTVTRIKASDGTHTACSNAITVSAGSANYIAFTTQPSSSSVAGVAFATQPVVKVYDANNNAITTLNSGSITLSISTGSLSAGTTASISAGTATFSGTKTNEAGAGKTLTASYGALTVQSNTFTILPAAFDLTQSTFTVSANTVVSGASIVATLTTKDAFGNSNPSGIVVGTSDIAFSSSLVGGTGTFDAITSAGSGVYTANFTGGASGAVTLSASIQSGAVSQTQSVTVTAGAASELALTSIPATQEAGSSFNFSVTAKDSFGNTVTAYPETVTITSTDGTAILPSASTLINGTKNFLITLHTLGTQTITASDGALTVTSDHITITPTDEAPPPDPTDLSSTVLSATQISLNWASGGGTTADYRIAYQSGATAPASCSVGTTISEAAISGTGISINGLTSNTLYSFRVCAINTDGTPDVSAGITTTANTNALHAFPIGINHYYYGQPYSAWVDVNKNLYIADTTQGKIFKYDSDGNKLLEFGSTGNGNGQFGTWSLNVAVDSSGNIYISDQERDRIHKFNSSGVYQTTIGSSGSANGELSAPSGIAIDTSNNIYVADTGNSRIQKFNTSGVYQSKFGTSGSNDGEFTTPNALAVDVSGNIYVGDSTSRVQKFNSSATHQLTFGSNGTGNGQFSIIGGITVGSDGKIYVSDANNGRIQKFNTNGSYSLTFDLGKLGTVHGIAIDSSGKIYAADTNFSRVQVFNSFGSHIASYSPHGSGSGEFNQQRGIHIDSNGNIYVADMKNNRIQKFDSSGTRVLSFGSSGTGNGQFNQPQDVVVDGSGNIYVADTNNNRIQKFNSSGTFLTQWGSYGTSNGQFDSPTGITAGTDGVFIMDAANSRYQKFNFSGVHQMTVGSNGSAHGQFLGAEDLSIDSSDNIYVADLSNSRIEKYLPNGSYSATISVGTNAKSVTVDSNGNIWTLNETYGSDQTITQYNSALNLVLSFNIPYGAASIAIDSNGDVLVSNTTKSVIKKYNTSGVELFD